jgi:ribonuclease HII
VVKGDSLSCSIAAASILAKVARDRVMTELHHRYPDYGFASHKGYHAEIHVEALRRLGPCPEHRLGWAPVRLALEGKSPMPGADAWAED